MASAESLVQVTEGSGKKLHTISRTVGANTVEDEVVLLGEQNLATYAGVSGSGIAASTALAHLFQIMAGASNAVYLRRIFVTQNVMATAASLHDFILCRLTTAGTGGTVVTASPMDDSDAAFSGTMMTLPSAKGTEGVSLWRQSGYFCQTMPVSGGAEQGLILDLDFDKLMRGKPPRIAPGVTKGLALKLVTAPAAATVTVTVIVSEASY